MRPVIDLEYVLPPDENGVVRQTFAAATHRIGEGDPELLPPLPGYGFDNYRNIFTRREGGARKPEADKPAAKKPAGKALAEIVAEMDRDGVRTAVIHRISNDILSKITQAYPTRFFALAAFSPFDGMRAVREFDRLVREKKVQGLRVGALYNNLAASDRRYYPLYAKCAELDVPVRIYTSMNYANDRPYDLGHPRHLDQVAMDFPELRIVAGLGGWPWINDMVGLMRRHPNLTCDTASHHPRYFSTKGSGWEMLLQFGNTLLQDKIMVGFSSEQFGLSIPEMVKLYEALPLKEAVVEKWLYGNAKRFLRLD
jgi:predicted TIM-barrel fold metal-dependent hydrolase